MHVAPSSFSLSCFGWREYLDVYFRDIPSLCLQQPALQASVAPLVPELRVLTFMEWTQRMMEGEEVVW